MKQVFTKQARYRTGLLLLVVVTAMPDPDIDQRVAAAGGKVVLRKPIGLEALSAAIEANLRHD